MNNNNEDAPQASHGDVGQASCGAPARVAARSAIALALALAATLLCMIGDAHAQSSARSRSAAPSRTAMVTVTIGKSRGRAHRPQLRRRHGRRSRGRRRQPADRPHAVDPRQEDRHHPRVGLCRRQEADRHLRRRGVLRHLAAAATNSAAASRTPRLQVSSVNGRIMLSGDRARRRDRSTRR